MLISTIIFYVYIIILHVPTTANDSVFPKGNLKRLPVTQAYSNEMTQSNTQLQKRPAAILVLRKNMQLCIRQRTNQKVAH